MFTGLIAATGKIATLRPTAHGLAISVDISKLPEMPTAGASIAVNGCCLTVTALHGTIADFDAVQETINRTTLPGKKAGELVNLEPALRLSDRIDGHFVQGHVDGTSRLLEIAPCGMGQYWRFFLPEELAPLVALKGSVTVDGISLTVAKLDREGFTVSLIPHTIENTALAGMHPGAAVNLEVDVLARYLSRRLECAGVVPLLSQETGGGLTEDFLRNNGF